MLLVERPGINDCDKIFTDEVGVGTWPGQQRRVRSCQAPDELAYVVERSGNRSRRGVKRKRLGDRPASSR
jgi:hypothetical protein